MELTSKEDFEKQLEKLGTLYESTKDQINSMVCADEDSEISKSNTLTNLREIRNMTATLLQNSHMVNKN